MSDNSDFSQGEETGGDLDKKSRKDKGLISKKEKKEKKDKKEKETGYAHLGEDSSADEEVDGKSPAKTKKSKPFMFGSAKKDKEKKKEKEAKEAKEIEKEIKKKDKKDKSKKKEKEKHKHLSEKEAEAEECPIFGVPLDLAVGRNRCHDGIALPVLVRQCIDYIEAEGLMMEGIYRLSGVKSKVTKLRHAYNCRQNVNLYDYEPAVVASVLKQFLRELPDPVLTKELFDQFEKVSANPVPQKRIEGMKHLLQELPECNRLLIQYIFVHMGHVIERERFNKMTIQNVSIVLSPTMQISHRVLNCFFENSHILFDGVQIKKYIPPITTEAGQGGPVALPDTPEGIEEEIRKQESLLADLHLQISSGAASKKVEEQIWEQQRIVTQLKRQLRTVNKTSMDMDPDKPKFEPIDYEEELDFTLQQPKPDDSPPPVDSPQTEVVPPPPAPEPSAPPPPEPEADKESPEDKDSPDGPQNEPLEHKVTVMVHRSQEVEKPEAAAKKPETERPVVDPSSPPRRKNSHVTVIKLNSTEDETSSPDEPPPPTTDKTVAFKIPSTTTIPLLPPPPAAAKRTTAILRPVPASPNHKVAPPISHAPPIMSSLSVDHYVASAAAAKSKSLPRGLPSDGSAFDSFATGPQSLNPFPDPSKQTQNLPSPPAADNLEELRLEAMRLKFEYEELTALKSELERRKKSERNEIEEVREEIATMQTLYQYRTYSVDSSESSSDENSDKDAKEEVEELNKVLSDLMRENRELNEKRHELTKKIQEERSACVNLRVQIRMEQERIKKRRAAVPPAV